MTVSFFAVFILTVFIASITPGPSMLLALNHGARYGSRRAVATALGNAAATFLQCAVSLAGLGAILSQSAWIFTALRYAGAAYLIYLGARIFFSRGSMIAERKETQGRGLFKEAFIVTLGNPKAIFFFSALFPQFMEGSLSAAKMTAMTASTLAVTFACMMIYASLGDRIRHLFMSVKISVLFNRITGAALVGLGAGLALDDR